MGTDLYLSAERRDADGRWSLATPCPPGLDPELHQLLLTRLTTVTWHETYATSCPTFLENALPKLLALGPPDAVRIVFSCWD